MEVFGKHNGKMFCYAPGIRRGAKSLPDKNSRTGERKEQSMVMELREFITPTGAVILLVVVGIVVAACVYARKQRNKLMDEGKLISREARFWDKSETFSLAGVTLEEVYNKLPADDLKKYMGSYELQKDKNRIVFVHNGYEESFTGTLCLISDADGVYTYRLLINQYKTKHSSPNEMSLNVLYTAVEKVFLGFDPNIKVKSEYVDRKVKHSLF